MKTKLIYEVDGISIVYGIGNPSINRKATMRKLESMGIPELVKIGKTKEGKDIIARNEKITPELIKKNAVYFNLPLYEKIIDDNEAGNIKEKMIEGFVVTSDGEQLKDYRGKAVYEKITGNRFMNPTIALDDKMIESEPPGPEGFYKHNGSSWEIDPALKSEYDDRLQIQEEENLIQQEMRLIAKERLIAKGKIAG